MSENVDPEVNEVKWNMAALLNIELANLRTQANRYFIGGKYKNAIDTLMAMKTTGIHTMTQEERTSLLDIEKKFSTPLSDYNRVSSFNAEDKFAGYKATMELRKLFMEYSECLMDILHIHGFLGGYKKDSTRMNI